MEFKQFRDEVIVHMNHKLKTDDKYTLLNCNTTIPQDEFGVCLSINDIKSTVINLNQVYSIMEQSGITTEFIANRTLDMLLELFNQGVNAIKELSTDILTNKDKFLSQVQLYMVNQLSDEMEQEDVAHIEILDLAIFFHLNLNGNIIIVTNEVLNKLDLTCEQIKDVALANTVAVNHLKPQKAIEYIMNSPAKEYADLKTMSAYDLEAYLIDSSTDTYGSAALLSKTILSDIGAQLNTDELFIFVQTSHNIVIYRKDNNMINQLKENITVIKNALGDMCISDMIYQYCISTDTLSIAM